MKKRYAMQIMYDVLKETSQAERTGVGVTKLLTKSNLPYTRGLSLIQKLVGRGLMNKIETNGNNTYIITENGRIILEEYKKFSDLASTFGLEL
jgi:predicted transcriptional regulator|tara:strand:- start:10254 stop:10532 length:279 start_codon:yes stop_codon:yes gene_type:complete